MKRLYISLLVISVFLILLSCNTARRFGTTVERDFEQPCVVNMIIQIGIKGTDADVQKVRADLDACYGKECFIPCANDETRGCKTKISVVVKKWSTLKEEEKDGFHAIEMIDDDGLPSNAYIGKPNEGASMGTWRRNAHPRTYCHEVLHLCGLKDQYCSRLFDPVRNEVVTEISCETPPDPANGNCCTPHARFTRCSSPCTGHEHDLMATLSPELSCQNIKDVLKLAGIEKCPEECCQSQRTFADPNIEAYLVPGYMHFGDKNVKFGSIGAGLGGSWNITPKLGVTLEGSYYTHTEKHNSYKETSGIMSISAGITYDPLKISAGKSDFTISTFALGGISTYSQKFKSGSTSYDNKETSLNVNVGAAVDWNFNRNWAVRLLQASYMPTFFYDATQHNFRVGAGIVYKFYRKK